MRLFKKKTAEQAPKREKVSPFTGIYVVILILYVIMTFMLLLWGASTALKTISDFRTNKVWLPSGTPDKWGWNNFSIIIKNFYVDVTVNKNGVMRPAKIGVGMQIVNSILYAVGGGIVYTIVPAVVAYLTSKFRYKFSSFIYAFVIIDMIIPIVGQQASELQLLRALALFDSMVGSWIQKFHFLGMYYLVLHASFKGVSNEYSESAYIDGASEWRVMVSIVMPMVKTIMLTIFIIRFVALWNDYQTPLLYLPSHPTMAYGVYLMGISSRSNELARTPVRLASCVIMATPILLIFLAFKNRMMGNLSMGGLKE